MKDNKQNIKINHLPVTVLFITFSFVMLLIALSNIQKKALGGDEAIEKLRQISEAKCKEIMSNEKLKFQDVKMSKKLLDIDITAHCKFRNSKNEIEEIILKIPV